MPAVIVKLRHIYHRGVQWLSCLKSEGRCYRHTAISNIMHGALTSTHIPSRLEPAGICCSDGKCPDGMIVVQLRNGKSLDTLILPCSANVACEIGAVAMAAGY